MSAQQSSISAVDAGEDLDVGWSCRFYECMLFTSSIWLSSLSLHIKHKQQPQTPRIVKHELMNLLGVGTDT